jgi:acid phosphatase (class A)
MKKILLSLACVAALYAGPTLARDAAFVSAEQINAFQVLPEPPTSTSQVTQAELLELHRIESTRTPEQVERAMADDKNESIFIFQALMGEAFTAAKLPLTAALSAKLNNDESVNTDPAKNGFKRVRPYNLDKTLHPVCKTKTKNDSYPSGHTTTGYLMALALIDMVPEKRDAILARADDYANNRLICGVHYPSDLQASKLVAYSMHAVMGTNPKYRQELGAARLELRRVLGLASPAN